MEACSVMPFSGRPHQAGYAGSTPHNGHKLFCKSPTCHGFRNTVAAQRARDFRIGSVQKRPAHTNTQTHADTSRHDALLDEDLRQPAELDFNDWRALCDEPMCRPKRVYQSWRSWLLGCIVCSYPTRSGGHPLSDPCQENFSAGPPFGTRCWLLAQTVARAFRASSAQHPNCHTLALQEIVGALNPLTRKQCWLELTIPGGMRWPRMVRSAVELRPAEFSRNACGASKWSEMMASADHKPAPNRGVLPLFSRSTWCFESPLQSIRDRVSRGVRSAGLG